jgi:hypothetical protein
MQDQTQANERCQGTLEDINYLQDISELWSVDAEGEPQNFIESTDSGDFQAYQCNMCGYDFEDFEEIKRHLGITAEVAAG